MFGKAPPNTGLPNHKDDLIIELFAHLLWGRPMVFPHQLEKHVEEIGGARTTKFNL